MSCTGWELDFTRLLLSCSPQISGRADAISTSIESSASCYCWYTIWTSMTGPAALLDVNLSISTILTSFFFSFDWTCVENYELFHMSGSGNLFWISTLSCLRMTKFQTAAGRWRWSEWRRLQSAQEALSPADDPGGVVWIQIWWRTRAPVMAVRFVGCNRKLRIVKLMIRPALNCEGVTE